MNKQVQAVVSDRQTCPMCDGDQVTSRSENQTFIYGSDIELFADIEIHTCSDCGFVYTDDQAEVARHEAVCRHLGVLTSEEIIQIRELYGMSRPQFARAFGIGEASLDRWENGINIQNQALDQYLYLLAEPSVGEIIALRNKHAPLVPGTVHLPAETSPTADVIDLTKFRSLKNTKNAGAKAVADSFIFDLRKKPRPSGEPLCM